MNRASAPVRRRLSPQQRTTHLLDASEDLFRTTPFDDVTMQSIAVHAGVTRALLYHYFSSKAELFGQIWARAHSDLLSAAPTSAPTARAWIDAMLREYTNFYAANLPLVVIANRSSISEDPAVRGPVESNFAAIRHALLDATTDSAHARGLAEVGFDAWIRFARDTSLATLLDGRMSREEYITMCMAVFDGAVGQYADLQSPAPGA